MIYATYLLPEVFLDQFQTSQKHSVALSIDEGGRFLCIAQIILHNYYDLIMIIVKMIMIWIGHFLSNQGSYSCVSPR